MTYFTLIKPDDWHLHLRDNDYLETTVAMAAQQFGRAIVMPNLKPPVTSVQTAKSYHQRILAAIPPGLNFEPLMTLYLTEETTPALIASAKASKLIYGFKLYPAGVTTHSQAGVKNFSHIYPVLAAMEQNDMPLLIHAESADPTLDIFDREQHFLDHYGAEILKRFPKLRVVVEHISTEYGIRWVEAAPANVAATITPHHLLLNRNDLLSGGIHPHFYCLPVVKTQRDQTALIAAAISGNPKFFLGTDSAPHPKSNKESACGSAGIFSSHAAIELYATIFENAGALNKLEGFASFFGADFYQLPRHQTKITLAKQTWEVPAEYPYGKDKLVPLFANQMINWKLVTDSQ